MKPSTILKRARKLIERGWCKGPMAADKHGNEVIDVFDPAACSWCAMGAVKRAANGNADIDIDVCRLLSRANPKAKYITHDGSVGVGQRSVLRAFDRAIKLAESEGK